MKTLSTTFLSTILKYSLFFIFAFGIFFTPFCHWFMENYLQDFLRIYFSNGTAEYKAAVIEIYSLGIVMLLIVTQLIRICNNVIKNTPFIISTSASLKNIAVLSFVMVVILICKFIVFPALPGLLIAITFIIIGMLSSVISQLFKTAVQYKEENDLTV